MPQADAIDRLLSLSPDQQRTALSRLSPDQLKVIKTRIQERKAKKQTLLSSSEAASKSEFEAHKPDFEQPGYAPLKSVLDAPIDFQIGVEKAFGIDPMHPIRSLPGAVAGMVEGVGTLVRHPMDTTANIFSQFGKGVERGATAIRDDQDLTELMQSLGELYGIAEPGVEGVKSVGQGVKAVGRAVAPAVQDVASVRGIPEALETRAAANKVPLGRQPWQERALIIGPASAAGYAVGGPIGAAGAAFGTEGLALIRRSNWYRSGKAALQERIAKGLTDPNAAPPPVRTSPAGITRTEVPFNAPAGLEESPSTAAGQFKPPVTGPREEIPFNTTDETAGSRPDFKSIEQKIAPSGARAKQSSIAVDAQGNPTSFGKRLVDVVPELVTAAKGPRADAALMDGYRRAIQQVNEVEDVIPEGTTVDQIPITSQFNALVMEYFDKGLDRTAKMIEGVRDQWLNLTDKIPWGEFLARKRAFFQEHNLRSAPMRRTYGVLMEAAGRVSPELAEANSRYSVVRRALDNAGIDVNTGRRIRDVGKSGKSSAMPMSERGEPPTGRNPVSPVKGAPPPTIGELRESARPKEELETEEEEF